MYSGKTGKSGATFAYFLNFVKRCLLAIVIIENVKEIFAGDDFADGDCVVSEMSLMRYVVTVIISKAQSLGSLVTCGRAYFVCIRLPRAVHNEEASQLQCQQNVTECYNAFQVSIPTPSMFLDIFASTEGGSSESDESGLVVTSKKAKKDESDMKYKDDHHEVFRMLDYPLAANASRHDRHLQGGLLEHAK